jgi:hypothetical protein
MEKTLEEKQQNKSKKAQTIDMNKKNIYIIHNNTSNNTIHRMSWQQSSKDSK